MEDTVNAPKTSSVSRATIEKVLTDAIIEALDDLHLPQDARHLCRVFRALLGVGLDCMAAGSAPVEVVTVELNRVLSRRLKKPPQKTPPGTLGSCVQRAAKA
jgi:hypothetical protein